MMMMMMMISQWRCFGIVFFCSWFYFVTRGESCLLLFVI